MVDLTDAPLHTPSSLWTAIVAASRFAVQQRLRLEAARPRSDPSLTHLAAGTHCPGRNGGAGSGQGRARAAFWEAEGEAEGVRMDVLRFRLCEHSAWAHGAMGLMGEKRTGGCWVGRAQRGALHGGCVSA